MIDKHFYKHFSNLSFDEFCANKTRSPTRYDLYAVINHIGSLHGGHCELLLLVVPYIKKLFIYFNNKLQVCNKLCDAN